MFRIDTPEEIQQITLERRDGDTCIIYTYGDGDTVALTYDTSEYSGYTDEEFSKKWKYDITSELRRVGIHVATDDNDILRRLRPVFGDLSGRIGNYRLIFVRTVSGQIRREAVESIV